jgi:hypothetical protein
VLTEQLEEEEISEVEVAVTAARDTMVVLVMGMDVAMEQVTGQPVK